MGENIKAEELTDEEVIEFEAKAVKDYREATRWLMHIGKEIDKQTLRMNNGRERFSELIKEAHKRGIQDKLKK